MPARTLGPSGRRVPRQEHAHDPHHCPPEHAPPTPSRRSAAGWFRAFWRWHFYASLVVVPVLVVLAVTGLVYLLGSRSSPGCTPT